MSKPDQTSTGKDVNGNTKARTSDGPSLAAPWEMLKKNKAGQYLGTVVSFWSLAEYITEEFHKTLPVGSLLDLKKEFERLVMESHETLRLMSMGGDPDAKTAQQLRHALKNMGMEKDTEAIFKGIGTLRAVLEGEDLAALDAFLKNPTVEGAKQLEDLADKNDTEISRGLEKLLDQATTMAPHMQKAMGMEWLNEKELKDMASLGTSLNALNQKTDVLLSRTALGGRLDLQDGIEKLVTLFTQLDAGDLGSELGAGLGKGVSDGAGRLLADVENIRTRLDTFAKTLPGSVVNAMVSWKRELMNDVKKMSATGSLVQKGPVDERNVAPHREAPFQTPRDESEPRQPARFPEPGQYGGHQASRANGNYALASLGLDQSMHPASLHTGGITIYDYKQYHIDVHEVQNGKAYADTLIAAAKAAYNFDPLRTHNPGNAPVTS